MSFLRRFLGSGNNIDNNNMAICSSNLQRSHLKKFAPSTFKIPRSKTKLGRSVNNDMTNKEITIKIDNIPEIISLIDNIDDQKACAAVFHALNNLQPDHTPNPHIGVEATGRYYNIIGGLYYEKIHYSQLQKIESYNTQLLGAPITDIYCQGDTNRLILVVRVTKRATLNVTINNHPNGVTQQPSTQQTNILDINYLPPVINKKRKICEDN